MNHVGSKIEMPYEVFREMEHELETLKATNEELTAHPPVAPESAEGQLAAALGLAIPLIQFAMGNLPPETTLGWPFEALHDFGEMLRQTNPDSRLQEFAQQCIELADRISDTEAFRNDRTAQADAAFVPDDAAEDPAMSDSISQAFTVG